MRQLTMIAILCNGFFSFTLSALNFGGFNIFLETSQRAYDIDYFTIIMFENCLHLRIKLSQSI